MEPTPGTEPGKISEDQPAVLAALVLKAVTAVLGMLVILKAVHLDGTQVATIAIAVEAVLAIPATIFVWRRVTPTSKVAGIVEAAKAVQKEEIHEYLAAGAPPKDVGQVPTNTIWTVVGILLIIVLAVWLVRAF